MEVNENKPQEPSSPPIEKYIEQLARDVNQIDTITGFNTPRKKSKYSFSVENIMQTFTMFGRMLAITVSFSANKSILWAILHGFLGWFYVLYYWIFK